MARLYSIRPTLSLKGRRSQGLRGFSGKPFHPPLTDIPVGAYIIAAGLPSGLLIYAAGEGESARGFLSGGERVDT